MCKRSLNVPYSILAIITIFMKTLVYTVILKKFSPKCGRLDVWRLWLRAERSTVRWLNLKDTEHDTELGAQEKL